MNSRKLELTVGVFVLIGLAAVTFLAIRIGGVSLFSPSSYTLSARFTNASGLKPGSSVRIAGVGIGDVKDVSLNRQDMVALVTFTVPADIKLDDDTVAAVRSSGLIGEKYVLLKPGASGTPLKAGALILDTESSVDLEDLISRFAFGSVGEKK